MSAVELYSEALGVENLTTLDPDGAATLGLSAADHEVLVEVGLPLTAGPVFAFEVDGEPDTFTTQRMTAADGTENLALFIGGHRDRPELRYFLDVGNGCVVLCSLDEQRPVFEVVNSSLTVFVEFLLRFAVYYEKESATVAEDLESVAELAALLHGQDPYSVRNSGTWWARVLEGLRSALVAED
ncbi:SUKH-4 family immunity protein [Kribbella sp. NPDC004536]|uniref:SUKH-4 family immunity protein n=1 Tax=Kribbella sp. NPDC004536 TaxID=3364106 RepID=UPI0036CFBF24